MRKKKKGSKLNTVTILSENASAEYKATIKDEDVKLVDLHSLARADTVTGRLNSQLMLLEQSQDQSS